MRPHGAVSVRAVPKSSLTTVRFSINVFEVFENARTVSEEKLRNTDVTMSSIDCPSLVVKHLLGTRRRQ
jgi:hypothetical protein